MSPIKLAGAALLAAATLAPIAAADAQPYGYGRHYAYGYRHHGYGYRHHYRHGYYAGYRYRHHGYRGHYGPRYAYGYRHHRY